MVGGGRGRGESQFLEASGLGRPRVGLRAVKRNVPADRDQAAF